jgi:hypothetical protein
MSEGLAGLEQELAGELEFPQVRGVRTRLGLRRPAVDLLVERRADPELLVGWRRGVLAHDQRDRVDARPDLLEVEPRVPTQRLPAVRRVTAPDARRVVRLHLGDAPDEESAGREDTTDLGEERVGMADMLEGLVREDERDRVIAEGKVDAVVQDDLLALDARGELGRFEVDADPLDVGTPAAEPGG